MIRVLYEWRILIFMVQTPPLKKSKMAGSRFKKGPG